MTAAGAAQRTGAAGEGRERILEAAIRLFAEAGYDGTSTAGVAREAGVAQPLVHHHFGSKAGLWQAAMDRAFADVQVFSGVELSASPHEALAQAMEAFLQFCARRPEMARLVQREGSRPSWRLDYLVEHHLRAQYAVAVETFRRAQEAGLFDASVRPELALLFVIGAGSHFYDVAPLAQQALGIEANEADRRAYAKMAVTLVLRGLRAEP